MNRKERYNDLTKWRETCRKQKKRYYDKSKGLPRTNHRWTASEIKLVMNPVMTDSELSTIIGRSVNSIQTKRCMINKLNKNKEVA